MIRRIGPVGALVAPSSSHTSTGKETKQTAKKSKGAWERTASAPARNAVSARRHPHSKIIRPARRSMGGPSSRESPTKVYQQEAHAPMLPSRPVRRGRHGGAGRPSGFGRYAHA